MNGSGVLKTLESTYQYWGEGGISHVIYVVARALIFGTDVKAFLFVFFEKIAEERNAQLEMTKRRLKVRKMLAVARSD